jgi:hypothetical protein
MVCRKHRIVKRPYLKLIDPLKGPLYRIGGHADDFMVMFA